MNITDFGFNYDLIPENTSGTSARIISVHKGRSGVVSDFGEGYAQLKSKVYYTRTYYVVLNEPLDNERGFVINSSDSVKYKHEKYVKLFIFRRCL